MTFIKGYVTLNLVDYDRPCLTMMALDDHGLLYFMMAMFDHGRHSSMVMLIHTFLIGYARLLLSAWLSDM
jgi:hypothetical protein